MELLINELKIYPGLWNTQTHEYKDSTKKKAIWIYIGNKLGQDAVFTSKI